MSERSEPPAPGQPTLPDDLEDEVLQALEQDDAARDAALATLLEREPAHATAIRRWLLAAGVRLGASACPEDDDELCDPPRRIGKYRLLRLLGRGAFGSVHLCEHDGMPGRFALKLLHQGLDSRDVLRRFAAEREALLRLDHPGIAHLIDAGETAAGRPFFVMEHIDGDPLLVHCRRHGLDLAQRIRLFLRVLDATAHAHQRGILHRDLSGSNVLVQGQGDAAQPKIIDFGVAKSIAEPLVEDGAMTFQGTLMGTPEYMSPEQAQGQLGAIDTRTDVYSLGVQLYELLADQQPIPGVVLRAQGIGTMAQVIARHVPARPSQVAPRPLQAQLRGDLDAIAMKAIAKDREERYASATEFAADLRRYLAHDPVLASPPRTWYLLRKFARRHRGRVVLAGLAAAALLAALLVSLHQWRAARDARAQLQRMHEELAARAEGGFRLLASQQRLRAAERAAATLVPPWPDRVPALQEWLRRYGAPLQALLTELAQRRDELRQQKERAPGRTLADPIDEDLLLALDEMHGELQRFCGPGGTLRDVQRRLAWAQEVATPALQKDQAEWAATAAALRRDRGYQLAPQPGLAPLGRDPRTGLFEFLDLASHPAGAPLPRRDADGGMPVTADAGVVFVLVPAGSVRLGALRDEPGLPQNDPLAADDELGGRTATLTDVFVARTELTRGQWATLVGDDPPEQPQLPQTDVDWETAAALLQRWGMALPTEAQWEYVCRAGTQTPWWRGGTIADAGAVGHFGGELQPVAQLPANAFGLFDVHGNAAEWCQDWKLDYGAAFLRAGDGLQLLPTPMRLPELRAVRGGSAASGPAAARSSARAGRPPLAREPMLGLRPVRAVVRP
ncbi:MAG: bifunctional serine/threonine-protein kinase/formylglycine-generating enzyme family protein [Planctomycetota bacterium]